VPNNMAHIDLSLKPTHRHAPALPIPRQTRARHATICSPYVSHAIVRARRPAMNRQIAKPGHPTQRQRSCAGRHRSTRSHSVRKRAAKPRRRMLKRPPRMMHRFVLLAQDPVRPSRVADRGRLRAARSGAALPIVRRQVGFALGAPRTSRAEVHLVAGRGAGNAVGRGPRRRANRAANAHVMRSVADATSHRRGAVADWRAITPATQDQEDRRARTATFTSSRIRTFWQRSPAAASPSQSLCSGKDDLECTAKKSARAKTCRS